MGIVSSTRGITHFDDREVTLKPKAAWGTAKIPQGEHYAFSYPGAFNASVHINSNSWSGMDGFCLYGPPHDSPLPDMQVIVDNEVLSGVDPYFNLDTFLAPDHPARQKFDGDPNWTVFYCHDYQDADSVVLLQTSEGSMRFRGLMPYNRPEEDSTFNTHVAIGIGAALGAILILALLSLYLRRRICKAKKRDIELAQRASSPENAYPIQAPPPALVRSKDRGVSQINRKGSFTDSTLSRVSTLPLYESSTEHLISR